jgi:aminopeptidase YwaD
LEPTEESICKEISARRALENVRTLCSFGDRFVGEEGDRKSIEFVIEKFKSFGLRVEETPIRVLSFRQNMASIVAGNREFAGLAPYFTPSAPSGGVVGELVDVLDGNERDFEGKDVSGKIVLLRARSWDVPKFWMGPIAQRAAKLGAVGMILICAMPYAFRPSMETGFHDVSKRFLKEQLPMVSVSSTDGHEIMYLLGKGDLKVKLNVQTELRDKDSVVITAFAEGDSLQEDRVAMIAHRDHGVWPGANDNGTGTGTLLEVARSLGKFKHHPRAFQFISSTAEEGITIGAYHYVQSHKKEMKNIKAVINVDMIGTGGRLNLIEKGVWPDLPNVPHAEWLNKMLEQVADEHGYNTGRMIASWGVSEEGRFIDEGVPGAWFWKPDDPYYHSQADTPDKLDANTMKVAGDIVASTMWRIANMMTVPTSLV